MPFCVFTRLAEKEFCRRSNELDIKNLLVDMIKTRLLKSPTAFRRLPNGG